MSACSRSKFSFFIKRWCNQSAADYANNGLDDNAFKATSFAYVHEMKSDTAPGSYSGLGLHIAGLLEDAQRIYGNVCNMPPECGVQRRDMRVWHKLLRKRLHLHTYVALKKRLGDQEARR